VHGSQQPVKVKDSEVTLNSEEFMCLVVRECGTRFWSGQTSPEHQVVCRFCSGELKSAAESIRLGKNDEEA
jgi:hypothetical protein